MAGLKEFDRLYEFLVGNIDPRTQRATRNTSLRFLMTIVVGEKFWVLGEIALFRRACRWRQRILVDAENLVPRYFNGGDQLWMLFAGAFRLEPRAIDGRVMPIGLFLCGVEPNGRHPLQAYCVVAETKQQCAVWRTR